MREPDELGLERAHAQLAFGLRVVELAEPDRYVAADDDQPPARLDDDYLHAMRLALIGPVGDPEAGVRDSSRLLGRAPLLVQRFAGVPAEPLLTPPGADAVVDAAAGAALLAVGLSSHWREEGLGAVRARIASESAAPVVVVARGLRPGGLAPESTLTRFSWSLREAPAS